MRLREVVAGGAALTLREWGEPGGTACLFWHSVGPLGSGAMLDPAAGPLADAGLHVIALDAPGFGRSPALDADGYSLERLAELLWAVADTLDAERPIWPVTRGVAPSPSPPAACGPSASGRSPSTTAVTATTRIGLAQTSLPRARS